MKYSWFSRSLFVLAAGLLLAVTALFPLKSGVRSFSTDEEVQAAWQRARQAGVYHFATEIVQTTHPAPKLANIGRSSRQDTLHIEGQANLPERTLLMTLWQDGGSVLNARDGVEVRIEGDRAYGRQLGGVWEEIPDFSGAFAPGNDLLAYLAGAKNVRLEATDEAQGVTHYRFDVDGPAFATHLRDQLERHLIEKGELPVGLTLETSNLYRGVTGQGQIWIDDDGLPLRLSVHVQYPPEENGDRVEAQIQTDFSGFDRQRLMASSTWAERLAGVLRLPRTWEGQGITLSLRRAASQMGLFLGCIGLVAVLITHSRLKKAYTVLSLSVIVSMIVTPLLQSHQVAAFAERQAARQAALEQEQEAQTAARDLEEELLGSDWDPLRDPLAAPAAAGQAAGAGGGTTAGVVCTDDEKAQDSDQDGLSDCQERQYQTDPKRPDTDGDGLWDSWEVLRLGSEPTFPDTDGDSIPDGTEVRGFDFGGRHWYLDPNSVDSNNDGRPDTIECPGLGTTSQTCPDTDRDSTPDLFDRDDDGDGVPDRIDTAPTVVVGQATPFNRERPFELVVNGLNANYPVLVDLQLRPVNPQHLTYALNVLDWPSGDEDGQVQRRRGNDSTFADYMSAQDADNDPRSRNGDTRLIPMLEVELAGNDLPLPLTTTLRTRVQAQGVDASWPITTQPPVLTTWLSATVNLSQVGSATRLGFQLQGTSPVTAEIYAGACDGGVLDVSLGQVSNGQTRDISNRDLLTLADGAHVLVLKADGHTAACATIADVPNGPYMDRMIDTEPLRAYGASARDLGDGRVALLIPLTVVADETGGGRAAFGARVPYTPRGTSLGAAQRVRVVWLVQMLADYCRPMPPGSDATSEDWCKYRESWVLDNTQIVHTYYDDWYLTGLTVREDHGTDVAIAWEDPAAESQYDRQYDDWLWLMALGLEQTYLTGRDQNNNTLRDIGVVTHAEGRQVADTSIAGRFDPPLGSNVTITDRLGVPLTATLQVATFSYPQQDYVAYVMMTETVRILNNNFTTYKDQGADAPTLLFLRDERYRAAELGMGNEVTISGARVTFNLGGRSVETLASMSWAPYRYKDGRWQAYPVAEYWNSMYARFANRFPEDPKLPEDWRKDVQVGQITLAQSYYFSMMQGRVGLVAVGEQALQLGLSPKDEDVTEQVADKIEEVGGALQAVNDLITESILEKFPSFNPPSPVSGLPTAVPTRAQAALKGLGERALGKITTRLPFLKKLASDGFQRAGTVGLGLATAAAIACGVAGAFTSGETATRLKIASTSISFALATVGIAMAVVKYATCAANQVSKAARWAGVIGTVIAVGTAIAVMIAAIVLGPQTAEAIAMAVSAAIGQIIAAIVLFVIALIPIYGQLIVAIIALVDAVVSLMCAARGWDEDRVGASLCGGVSSALAMYFTPYSYNVMVNIAEEGRFQFADPFDYVIRHPEQGLVAGNELEFTARVRNTIQFAEFPVDWKAFLYSWQWNSATLRSSTFVYRLQSARQDIHQNIERGTQNPPWQATGQPSQRFPRYAAPVYILVSPEGDNARLEQAGINQPVRLFLAEGYALPAQECVGIGLVVACWLRTSKGTLHTDLGKIFSFDVFPATLDGFYQAVAKHGGYSLAWGQTGNVTFPRQKDLDGDGLRNAADGGSDPDDSQWDADGDGLSDLYESQHRSDPARSDTDGDGLDDAEETRLRTDPSRQDSDSDGLTDKEEVDGWEFVYAFDTNGNQLRTLVTSDPLERDTDGDGLSDFKEKAFGLNPRVVSDPNVLGLEAKVTEIGVPHNPNDFIVRGGDTMRYTATVENKLDSRFAQGLFSLASSPPAILDTAGVPPVQFILPPRTQATLSGTLGVASMTASQPVSLTQVAGALITDWREQSNGAEMWLPLNEPASATTFMDHSGNVPLRNATCSGSTCPASGVPGYLGNGVRFDGANDYLVVQDSPGFDFGTGGLTIAMWVKPGSWDGTLLSWKNAQDNLRVYLAGRELRVDLQVDGSGGTLTYNGGWVYPDEWHHVAVVRDGAGKWTTYVDGAPGGSGTSAADLNQIDSNTPIWLGAENNGSGNPTTPFNGSMDEVYIYRRALTPEEIAALYGRPALRLQMENPSYFFADSSGLNNHAVCSTYPNPCSTGPGIVGGAARFDGSNCLAVQPSSSLDLSGGRFTIAAWVYPDSNSGDQAIWGNYDTASPSNSGPTLFRTGTRLRFGFGDGSQWKEAFNVSYALTLNTWNHVVVTYDGAQVNLYVNGIAGGPWNVTGSPRSGTFFVGAAAPSSYLFTGRIDELSIYRRPLDADEVNELYRAGAMALYLPLDDAPGSQSLENAANPSGQSNAYCAGSACPVTGVSGRMNQAALFDGVDDALTTSLLLDQWTNSSATMMAWVYPSSTSPGVHPVLSSGNGWSLLRNNNVWAVSNGSTIINTSATVEVNRWQHVTAVFISGIGVLFSKNGGPQTYIGTVTLNSTTNPIAVGGNPAGSQYFDGRIDDVRVFSRALDDAELQRMFKAAPVFQMHLDDPLGATTFTDDANGNHGVCSGAACPTVGEAVRGQVGTAAEFDGNDVITVTDSAPLDLTQFTLSVWVKPVRITSGRQVLLHKGIGSGGSNYELYIDQYSGQVRLRVATEPYCSSNSTTAGVNLVPDEWNHVVATYNGLTVRLYVNGYQQFSDYWGHPACVNDDPLLIGNGQYLGPTYFAGRLDEVTLYDHALSPLEVRDLFRYQARWVESRSSQNILVDNDWPSSTLRSYNPAFPFLQNRDYVMHVEAHESTSSIAAVELGVTRDGLSYTWTAAPACLDAAGDTAFCPTFTPPGEGRYGLQTRATDVVSHTETPTRTYTLYVDSTPPQVGFDSLEANSSLSATLHPSQRDVWVVHLSGTIADPSLPGGYPGSGVQTDTVRVSLSKIIRWAGNDSTAALVRPGDQLATVSGNSWTIDYQIWDAQPSGIYSITVQAADRVGNQHTVRWEENYGGNPPIIVPRTFSVDATAPATNLEAGVPAMVTDTAWLRGNATDDPVPVVVTYTVGSDSGETGVSIYCGDPAQEIEILHHAAVYTQPAGVEWSGLASRNDYCWVSITNTIGANVVTGTARVCGEAVASWTPSAGEYALIQFDVRSDACGPYYHTAGVCQVQTEFVPNTPGTTYYNDRLLAGTALYVPFEDQPDVNGTLRVQDVGPQRLTGSCQDANCPSTGATGHIGNAARFDYRQGDSVRFDNFGAFTTTTIAAWVWLPYYTPDRQVIVAYKDNRSWVSGCGAALTLNELGGQYIGFTVYVDGMPPQYLQATQWLPVNTWAHLAGTYDGQRLRLYLNGEEVANMPASGVMRQCNGPTTIGSNLRQDGDFFPGIIDEVYVLDHALSADQVRALYRGSGPALALPFDQAWAVNGATPEDTSGWAHQAVLNSGAGDALNKAVPGAVGPRALHFDGVDDYVSVPDSPSLNPPYISIAGWIKADNFAEYGAPLAAKGTGAGGEVWALDFDYGGVPRFYFFKTGDVFSTACWGNAPLTPGQWVHVAGTYDGATERIYVNGVLNNSCPAARGPLDANTHIVSIGSRQSGSGAYDLNFAGDIDDVRIYPRALSALEIQALAAGGWQAVDNLDGAGTRSAVWGTQPPFGLEGSYRFDVRGEDCYGLVDTSVRSQGAWRGEVDTLAPRVTITRTTVNGKLRYTATAEDYNLVVPGFSSPCGAGVFTTREPFESPWYVALTGQRPNGNERLYRLTATCDLAMPPSLVEAGALNTPGLAQGVALSGNYAYVADGHGGLRVVDISNPQQPRLAGVYPLSGQALAVDVAVAGNYAYLVVDDPAGDRLVVLNVSNPAQPQYAGAYTVTGTELAHGIAIGGDNGYLHVPANVSGVWGVLVLTAADNPAYVNHIPTAGQPRGVAAVGDRLYVTEDGGNTLRIFQMPATTELGHYALPARGWDVAVSGSYAYVAADVAGLQIINVSNPTTPTLAASFDTPGLARAVVISGTHALVADGVRGLQMIDVAFPAFPQSVGALDTPGHAVDLAHAGGYAYLADESMGLRAILLQPGPAERVTACDSAGHCVVELLTLPGPAEGAQVSVLNVPPVLDDLTPFAIQGEALAFVSSLQALTVTVDGGVLYTANWPSGALTQTLWATPAWTPTEGPHQVVATLTTWGGDVAVDVADIIVDTLPPAVGIAPTVLTTTHYHPPLFDVTGWVTDVATGLPDVVWRVGSEDWQPAAVVSGTWAGGWYLGGTPDGVTYAIGAQATDVAGHTALATEIVVVDITPPTPVTLTLSSSSGVLEPGATVREPSPTLTLTWTEASDGSGVGGYLTRWTAQTTATLSITGTAYGPTVRSDPFTAGEAQKVWADLTGVDIYGNPRSQSIGPVYADSPFTPDYLDRPDLANPLGVYRGWMDSGCSQVGVDRRVGRSALPRAALSAEQRFYATWNLEALRLTWTGANWNNDGDLFIYLDLTAGGATTAYNPYGAGPTIHLPGVTPTTTVGAMAADYLVWVQDEQTASLLRWDGSNWTFESDLAQNALYQFIAAVNNGQTDLYLPFGLLGIGDPAATSLDAVALASDEGALSLWAAMPNGNPLNSPRIVDAISSDAPEFALSYRYHWASLGSGVCPNGSLTPGAPQYTDSDLHATLLVEPVGALRGMDAAQLWQWQGMGSDPVNINWLLGMDESGALLGDGLVVTFTLRVQNRGAYTATGVLGEVSAYYALRLPGGIQVPAEFRDRLTVNLGHIPPGGEFRQTFTGLVDRLTAASYYAACTASQPDYACADYLRQALLEVRLYDEAHYTDGPALQRLWSRHQADMQPPDFVGVQQPGYIIAARDTMLVGYAYDASPVPTITLTITGPSGSSVQHVCLDDTPADGGWVCEWDTNSAHDGEIYAVSVQATDRFGQDSAWSKPRMFLVDARPPGVSLDLAQSHLDISNVMRGSNYPLYGQITDTHGLGTLDVCVDGRCKPAQLWLRGGDSSHIYEDEPAVPLAIDAGAPCSAPILRTFVVTDSFVLGEVSVGLDIEHPHRDDVQAELISPSGTRVRLLYHSGVTGAAWANYDVFLNDPATTAYSAGGDDNPAAAYYDRIARPNQPLQAFYGEDAAGTWTLSICDLIPASGDGQYHRSQLRLQPRETAARSADWTFTVRNDRPMDWVTQTVSLYGEDAVGNRMSNPLTFDVIVDNVAPVITTTQLARSLGLTLTVAALAGTVSDGGGVAGVFVTVWAPEGVYRDAAVLNGNAWRYALHPISIGVHRLQVTAVDLAGNIATTEVFEVEIRPITHVYLPLVMRRYTVAPDLIVENIIATPNHIQIVIRNRGNAPVEDEFWVDVYINPRTEPTQVNQTWDLLSNQGLAWGVTAAALPALTPGGTLTLTVGDAYYAPDYSRVSWPLAVGVPVYAQVDSYNAETSYGAVLERHEIIGEDYNNIEMEEVVAADVGAMDISLPTPISRPLQLGNLPRRP
ncbi:MAG: LamG-like jellyroll fold domain-containing protein [Anaerolineae bacterium]